ncbi:hypothetical protein ACLB2K_038330 [Fragaria x ananassa]
MATYHALLSLKSSLDDPDSRLTALRLLNVFNRTFPPELSNLTNLRVLDLYNNNLTGVLPVSVATFHLRTELRSPPFGAGEGSPPPQQTPAASPTIFPHRRVRQIPVFRQDHPKFQIKSISPETGIRRPRWEGKVIGDAAGVCWGGGAPSSAPEGGERSFVRSISFLQRTSQEVGISGKEPLAILEDRGRQEVRIGDCRITRLGRASTRARRRERRPRGSQRWAKDERIWGFRRQAWL